MYFKTLVKRVAKEIISKEKIECEKNGWDLNFSLETIYHYEDLVLTVKNAKNYERIFELDYDDYVRDYGTENSESFDLWIISDHVLECIENLGYDMR